MKRITNLAICFIIFSSALISQSTVIDSDLEHLQSTLSMTSSQLKQFTISSDLDEDYVTRIEIEVSSKEGVLLSMQSTNIVINQGVNFSASLLGLNGLSLKFAKDAFRDAINNNFQFLPGNYTICYTLLSTELIPEYNKCFNIEVINPYELLLIYPFDQESIVEVNPVFTWTPIILNGKRIKYMMKLVESDKEELDETTFRISPGHFVIKDLINNNYPYGIKSPKLNKEKNYFWKVYAIADNLKITESEIWRFDFESQNRIVNNAVFLINVNNSHNSQPIGINSSFIGIVIDNYAKKYGKLLDIKDGFGNEIWSYEINGENIPSGQNCVEVDVESLFSSNKVYTVNFYGSHKINSMKLFKID